MTKGAVIAYRPDIDGLRAIAVMAVVLHHLSPKLVPGGYIGVDVFFVISGYLITKIIHREINSGNFSFAKFYERRVRRIFPALFAVIFAVLVAGWFIFLPADYLATLRAGLGTVLFSANIVFWDQLREGYFAPDAKTNPLLHMWSLGIEEQFYLLFPLALLLGLKYARRLVWRILLGSAVFSLVLAAALVSSKSVAVFFLPPFRAWELAVGCLLALREFRQWPSWQGREGLTWLGMAAVLLPVFLYTPATVFPGLSAVPPVLGTAMLIHAGAGRQTTASRLLATRPMVFVGLLSYSLYLWHWPLIVFSKYLRMSSDLGYWALAILPASLLVAWLSYELIEKPFRKRKTDRNWSRRSVLAGGAATALVVASLCVAGVELDGVEQRWPEAAVNVDRVRRSPNEFRKECDQKFCVIGDRSTTPDVLLWGDSHMLAWLPGFDKVLRELHRSAVAAPHSACPPLMGVDVAEVDTCKPHNAKVVARLRDGNLKVVILAANWKKYFDQGDVVLNGPGSEVGNERIARTAFKRTLASLSRQEQSVIVLGPVPTFPFDVPMNVARNLSEGTTRMALGNLDRVHKNNAAFYRAEGMVEQLDLHNVRIVDVAGWMCSPGCEVFDRGVLYRDSGHLSSYGAVRRARRLRNLLIPQHSSSAVSTYH